MTYYEIATDAHGRIDLCTGRLDRRGCGTKRTSVPGMERTVDKRIHATAEGKPTASTR